MINFNHIIHITRKPTLRSYRNFSRKVPKIKPHLIKLKKGYQDDFPVVQLKFIIPFNFSKAEKITKRFTRFYKPVENLFDVIIVPHRYIGEYLNPHTSFKILGEEKQCQMAGRFMSDLYNVYYGALDKKLQENKKNRKQSRRLRRRWNITGELKDARYSTSRFKERLWRYLESPISDLTTELSKKYPKTFNKGRLRTQRIKKYFYKKYGRSWRNKV